MVNGHREFGLFIPECTKRGIGKTVAYELLKGGHLETFTLGVRRYIYLDSLLSLPQRVGNVQQGRG
jgi:hypothetical protein